MGVKVFLSESRLETEAGFTWGNLFTKLFDAIPTVNILDSASRLAPARLNVVLAQSLCCISEKTL